MTTDDRRTLIVRVPDDLKVKIQVDAAGRSMSQQDVVGEILAKHYKVPYTSRGMRQAS